MGWIAPLAYVMLFFGVRWTFERRTEGFLQTAEGRTFAAGVVRFMHAQPQASRRSGWMRRWFEA